MPAPRPKTDAQFLDMTGNMVGGLALGVFDEVPEPKPGQLWSRQTRFGWVYPTRRHVESMIVSALMSVAKGGRGLTVEQVFLDAWEFVVADAGQDPDALALLLELYTRITGHPPGSDGPEPEEQPVEMAVEAIAGAYDEDADEQSLWVRAVRNLFPEHPQTPGSTIYELGGKHESQQNPWLSK